MSAHTQMAIRTYVYTACIAYAMKGIQLLYSSLKELKYMYFI